MGKAVLVLGLAFFAASCATGGPTSPSRGAAPASTPHQAMLEGHREKVAALEAGGARGEKLGEARAYLSELEYFLGKGDVPQSLRLDRLLTGVTSGAEGAPGPDTRDDQVALLTRLREVEAERARKRILEMEKERDAAVAEVVRTRARVQGMASGAEASAMFAEARVLVDRMAEEAFNTESTVHLRTARRRLEEGKAEMEKGNPGGAAFLFDQVSNSYNLFRKGNPRQLEVGGESVVLRDRPSASGKVLKTVRRNSFLEGLSRQEGWVQVRDGSGVKGWVAADSVR